MKADRVFFQGKYSIHSQFLDTTLQAEGILEEGETLEQGINQLRDRLNILADSYKGISQPEHKASGDMGLPLDPEMLAKGYQVRQPPPKEINLQSEVVEIIADCETLEQLAKFKDRCNTPELIKQYMNKLKELTK